MDDQWLTIHLDRTTHCWNLGQADAGPIGDLIARARTQVGFPCGDGWARSDISSTAIQLSPGEPHEKLLAVATVHPLSNLDQINPGACTDECARLRKAARIEAAEQVLAGLSDADVAALVARRVPDETAADVKATR